MFSLNINDYVRRLVMVHELGHAYADLNSGLSCQHGSISVHLRTTGEVIRGWCEHSLGRENAWERGISLAAGCTFEYLFLTERGKRIKPSIYDYVKLNATPGPNSDMIQFNKLPRDYPNEAEYISFVEAVNAAEDLWHSGGRKFVEQYLPLVVGKKNVDLTIYDTSN